MATLAEHPVVAQTSYDQDIDSFLNLDQISYTPSEPARSKIGLTSQPSLPSSEFVSSDARSSSFASSSQSPVAFPAPSHQYDEHKQQTGLPPGALAQAIPFNQITPMGFGASSPGFAMTGGDMFQPQIKRDEAPLDFNSTPSRNLSDMDLESDSLMTVPGFYFSPSSNKNQFVDPNALGGQEIVPMGPSTQVGRMYPGMHQQAAMAKAAQQQRQHDMLRQQQQQQLQQQPSNELPQTQHQHGPNALVEERITRLLQQMKSASGSPSDDSPSPSGASHLAKSKKDEQDMDEDERLLASEEGKKLSSKERRQLRNKVSARAFRSRRKEYIGQLESEVAQRTTEAHELRMQNRTLYEENARLTEFARTLLASPQFSQFLDEMNVNGLPSAQTQLPHQSQPQSQQPQPPTMSQPPVQQANLPKEPTPSNGQHEFQMQQQHSQMGMMMVPSQGIDVSTMNMNNGGWNTGIDVNFGNAPVFAVLEVPQPPILDTEALSGKPSSSSESFSSKDVPFLDYSPLAERSEQQIVMDAGDQDVVVNESDPVLALFADQPKQSVPEVVQGSSFDGIESGKACTFELVVENDSTAAANRLAYLCSSMEDAFQRITMLTAHLQ
ncbi:bZIP transcription factor [Aspergillus undulatus]|uniref:bZIP transcription factor n=1 Tax=Aspergillus undulatus TaxID=1810928 RepID=UPI003CCCDD15